MTTNRVRTVVTVVLWALCAVAWWRLEAHTGAGPLATLQFVVDAARSKWWAPVVFVAVSLGRPFAFVPATPMTVAAGVLFGPVNGVALAVLGANGAALVTYEIGRLVPSRDFPVSGRWSSLQRRIELVRTSSFESVLILRLLSLPYDLVGIACGALRTRRLAFLAATALGSFPSTVSVVLLGASLQRVDQGLRGLSGRTAALAAAVKVVGLVVAIAVRRYRSPRRADTTTDT